jgi:hypothetical protein
VNHPRGNRNSGAKIAARQAKAAEMMNANPGMGQGELAAALGISRQTFWRDLQSIEARYVDGSAEDVRAFKEAQYKALLQIESATAEGTIPPDVANALTRIRSEVAKLLGLNAPERSITAHVTANTAVQYRFLEHSHGLSPDQIEEVFKFMDALPRRKVSIADCFPQQTPQLTAGANGDD